GRRRARDRVAGRARRVIVHRWRKGGGSIARYDPPGVAGMTSGRPTAGDSGVCSTSVRKGRRGHMKLPRHTAWLSALLFVAPAFAADADRWDIPVATKTLDNGLTVVVSEDRSAPVVGVSVVYGIGMRLEPRNRTGFAHLFEHLMFEGSANAPEGVFDRVITGGGGRNNGSTRADFTNY